MNKSGEKSENVSVPSGLKKKNNKLLMAQDTKERGEKAVSSVLRALLAKSNWFHIMVLLSEQYSRL